MGAGEDGDVHGHAHSVGLVEPHAKVPLTAQQQQDEDADVHQAHACCGITHTHTHQGNTHTPGMRFTSCGPSHTLTLVSSGIVQVVQDGYQDVQHITTLQDEEKELL